jgi:hypothetical protein
MKKTTHMIWVVANPEPLLNKMGDSWTGPQFSRKATCNRALRQRFYQVLLSFAIEARRSTRRWLRSYPLLTLPLKGGIPPSNTATVNTDDSSNLDWRMSLSQEVDRTPTPTF